MQVIEIIFILYLPNLSIQYWSGQLLGGFELCFCIPSWKIVVLLRGGFLRSYTSVSGLIHLFIHPMFIVKNPVCVLDSRDKTVNKTIKRKKKNPRVYILVHEAHTNLSR